jgi:GTPase SAR1 family protein
LDDSYSRCLNAVLDIDIFGCRPDFALMTMDASSPQIQLRNLQSSDELGLVDAIDKLRSQGISHYVSLPQLIVCGDQSSGKSSVLDAISGIPFPTKDNLCTRFATEMILRRTATASISVSIVPSQDRSELECAQLAQFRESLTALDDIPILIERAKDAMGLSAANNAFSNDVLRIEISGSNRPHLTIVDLPGLIHSENKVQKAADIELVQRLVRSYMSNPRSIILAVVSARNDYANQVVLKLAREVDSDGMRTLGVITKPDTLPVGSESEAAFVALARNEDVYFRLGWHVLKNRDYETRHYSTEARDLAEAQFLSTGVWNDLPRGTVGIVSLRQRLSQVLLDQIRNELPRLAAEIEYGIEHCRVELGRLGESRNTVRGQRLYLLRIGQSFQSAVKAAKDGSYGDEVFGDARTADGYCKRLRAVIQNLNLEFAETMRRAGCRRKIIDDTDAKASGTVTRTEYLNDIRELLKRSRGRELPGMFNPLIVGELFYEQSGPWERLARKHVELAWKSSVAFLDLLVKELADADTAEALRCEVIHPAMDVLLQGLNRKLKKILIPFQTGHPITYNHYFTETIQNIREKRLETEVHKRLARFFGVRDTTNLEDLPARRVKMSSLVEALAKRNEADMDRYACSEILDCMEAYYKVSDC